MTFLDVDGILMLHCPLSPLFVPRKSNIQCRNIREVVDDHAHRLAIARLKLQHTVMSMLLNPCRTIPPSAAGLFLLGACYYV